MAVVNLTPALVRSARARPGSRLDLFDAHQRGLLLEVREGGGKTYYARYSNERGRERHIKIGPADVISLAQARWKARKLIAAAILGEDPQEQRQDLRRIPRFDEFVQSSLLPFLRVSKRSWKTDETMFRCHVLPRLGRLFLDEITSEHVSRVLDNLKAEGYASGTTTAP
jgi:hypothetical protein